MYVKILIYELATPKNFHYWYKLWIIVGNYCFSKSPWRRRSKKICQRRINVRNLSQFMVICVYPPTLPPVTLRRCLLWVNGCTKSNRNLRLYYRRLRLYYRSLRLYYRSLRSEVGFWKWENRCHPQKPSFFSCKVTTFFSICQEAASSFVRFFIASDAGPPSGHSMCRLGGSLDCGGWGSHPIRRTSWRWR